MPIMPADLQELAKLVPIGRCFDRGDFIEPANQRWRDIYLASCASKRTILKAGDTIPLKGVQIDVVASNGQLITKPLAGGGPNPLCAIGGEQAGRRPREPVHGRRALHVRQVQVPRSRRSRLGEGNGVGLSGQPAWTGHDLAGRTSRSARRRRRARISLCDQAAGGHRQQRTAQGSGWPIGGLAQTVDAALSANRRRRPESRASGRDTSRCSRRTRRRIPPKT